MGLRQSADELPVVVVVAADAAAAADDQRPGDDDGIGGVNGLAPDSKEKKKKCPDPNTERKEGRVEREKAVVGRLYKGGRGLGDFDKGQAAGPADSAGHPTGFRRDHEMMPW